MKKIIILSFLFGAFFQLAKAQQYIISPNDTIETIVPQNELTILDIYQRNISGGTIQLAWTKISESIPAGWDYSLCDKGTCYPGFPLSGSMSTPITQPDSGFMGVNVDPYSLTGTLTVRFYVYEISAPAQGDTLTWILTSQTTGIEDIANINVGIYPNPASDYININTINMVYPANVSIYDLNGRAMLKKNIMHQNEVIDIMAIPAGIYILEVQNKHTIRKSFIKQ